MRLPALLTFLWTLPAAAQQVSLTQIVDDVQGGITALEAGDTTAYLAGTGRAFAAAPGFPFVAYNHARALALSGDRDSALTVLGRLAREGAVVAFDAPTDSAFRPLAADSGFRGTVAAIERARQPVVHSIRAFEVAERDLIAEGVAYDARRGTLFLSSLYKRKIVAVSRDGTARDFVPTGADGLGPVVGMEVDPKRRVLWAASMYLPEGRIPFPDTTFLAHGVLFQYDVDTGKLVRRYLLKPGAIRHGFNDLTITPNGDVYVTDSQGGGVYRLAFGSDAVTEVVPAGTYIFPNGITRTDDGRRLFVAHGGGVDRIELPSHRRSRIATSDSLNLGGIDGLAFHRNSLIGHQPSAFNRVIRVYLDPDQAEVTRSEIVDRHHPDFAIPTTGEIAGDSYYYIANSQLRAFRDGKILPWEELKPVIVLKARLD
jgi:sugar lactone lactonase YvrE